MLTITTQRGKAIEIIAQTDLREPRQVGANVRAYCHLHGSDHQRSLSIDQTTGWGYCFNAACHATVLVAEWNPTLADRLKERHARGRAPTCTSCAGSLSRQQAPLTMPSPLRHPPRGAPPWQRDELRLLSLYEGQMRVALTSSHKAMAYLAERGIPLAVARATGVCTLPHAVLDAAALGQQEKRLLQRWTDRIIFPLASPTGKGYIGRSLWRWQPGVDENTHKRLLEQSNVPKRWIKTNPAGWFGYHPAQFAARIILVEGAFDRLTLLTAGFRATDVVALVGTAAQASWFPDQVQSILLALDADEGGREATRRLADQLASGVRCVNVSPPLQDGWGKDWNERWRRIGSQSVWPLYEAYGGLLDSG